MGRTKGSTNKPKVSDEEKKAQKERDKLRKQQEKEDNKRKREQDKIADKKNKPRTFTPLADTRLGDASLYYICGMVVDATCPSYLSS